MMAHEYADQIRQSAQATYAQACNGLQTAPDDEKEGHVSALLASAYTLKNLVPEDMRSEAVGHVLQAFDAVEAPQQKIFIAHRLFQKLCRKGWLAEDPDNFFTAFDHVFAFANQTEDQQTKSDLYNIMHPGPLARDWNPQLQTLVFEMAPQAQASAAARNNLIAMFADNSTHIAKGTAQVAQNKFKLLQMLTPSLARGPENFTAVDGHYKDQTALLQVIKPR